MDGTQGMAQDAPDGLSPWGISYSRGASKNDADPLQCEVADFRAFVDALDEDRTSIYKERASYVCGPMLRTGANNSGHRGEAGAQPRRWTAIDADRIEPAILPAWRTWCAQFSGCGWATHSATEADPRERVVIELDRPVDRDTSKAIGRAIIAEVAAQFGDALKIDDCTFRPEQPCFLPKHGAAFFRFDGEPLHVSAWLAKGGSSQARAPQRDSRNARPGKTMALADVRRGKDLHSDLLEVSAKLARQGVAKPTIEMVVAGVAENARTVRGERVDDLHTSGELARMVDGAIAKFGPKPSEKSLDDFLAYLPDHRFIHRPTRAMWPAASIDDSGIPWPTDQISGKPMKPSVWLTRFRAVEQMTWAPGEPELIEDRVIVEGGWSNKSGARVFNQYVAAPALSGDPTKAVRWRKHLRTLYPNEDEAAHIERWLAHRIQRPGEKINHALVLGGDQGIGKDTLLLPVQRGVGTWNVQQVSPATLTGRFNGFMKSVMLMVNEARDQGDLNRFAFYDTCKTVIAAPPDMVRIDEKNVREYPVPNVTGVVFTTNHRTDGLYLPADDRRHFVAWSEVTSAAFDSDYFPAFYQWLNHEGGIGHVIAFLRTLDLSAFDPKAPPLKTEAFWSMVATAEDPEDGAMRDLLEGLGFPEVVTVDEVIARARAKNHPAIADELADRKSSRRIPHVMLRGGYVTVRNPDEKLGFWKVEGRRCRIYGRKDLTDALRIAAARGLCRGRRPP